LNEDIFDDVELDDIEEGKKIEETENSCGESLNKKMEKKNSLFL